MLASLRPKALAVLGEVLDAQMPPPDHDNYMRMLSAKKDAAINVMTISLKADENCLRRRHGNVLERLYEAVAAEVAKQGRQLVTIEN